MKPIGLASDHAGFELKQYVKQWLEAKGWEYNRELRLCGLRSSLSTCRRSG